MPGLAPHKSIPPPMKAYMLASDAHAGEVRTGADNAEKKTRLRVEMRVPFLCRCLHLTQCHATALEQWRRGAEGGVVGVVRCSS